MALVDPVFKGNVGIYSGDYSDDDIVLQYINKDWIGLIGTQFLIQYVVSNDALLTRFIAYFNLTQVPKPEVYDLIWALYFVNHGLTSMDFYNKIRHAASTTTDHAKIFSMVTGMKPYFHNVNDKYRTVSPHNAYLLATVLCKENRNSNPVISMFTPYSYFSDVIMTSSAFTIGLIMKDDKSMNQYVKLYGMLDMTQKYDLEDVYFVIKDYYLRSVIGPNHDYAKSKIDKGILDLSLDDLKHLYNTELARYLGLEHFTAEELVLALHSHVNRKSTPIVHQKFTWSISPPSGKDEPLRIGIYYRYGDASQHMDYSFDRLINGFKGGLVSIPLPYFEEGQWTRDKLTPLVDVILSDKRVKVGPEVLSFFDDLYAIGLVLDKDLIDLVPLDERRYLTEVFDIIDAMAKAYDLDGKGKGDASELKDDLLTLKDRLLRVIQNPRIKLFLSALKVNEYSLMAYIYNIISNINDDINSYELLETLSEFVNEYRIYLEL